MGGYQANWVELRVRTGPYVTELASTVNLIDSDMTEMGRLSPPAAGESIASQLATAVKAWGDVVPGMAEELTLLGDSVKASATMIEKAEVEISGRFHQFSI